MVVTECRHGDDPTVCPPCKTPPHRVDGATLVARYHGRCAVCDEQIESGDRIAANSNGWQHFECAA